ncbi:MAG: ABC transporter substrate-binding protein [Spirochaetaceae bacterium]|nr:MAG: ABC transporter substrate-binding protein [Spirochaetaceae bacterium]
MKKTVGLILVIFVTLLLAACSRQDEKEPEIRIGFIAPFTGVLRDLGTSCLEGARIALEEIEHRGGLVIDGRRYRINLILKDGQNIPELAVQAAQELINHEEVVLIIGPPISSLAIPVAQLACQADVPMITQNSTHPDVTKGTDCVVRTCFTDTFQGGVMARFARENLQARTAAVLFDVAGAFNRTITEIFVNHFKEAGGQIVASESYTTGERDFRAHLRRIAESQPDVLFLPNYIHEIRLQIDQLRELGMNVQIIGADTMSIRNAELIARIEGAYFSTHFSAETPDDRVQVFSAEYQRKFQREPTAAVALTYDALNLYFQIAQEQGSIDPEKIVAAMQNLERYEGVTGIMEFRGSPDPRKSVVIIHVVDGEFRFHTRIDP